MYCRKLKNGKWSCTGDATADPLTGKRRQVTRRGDTKKEASIRVNEAIQELEDERTTSQKTVLQVYEEWMAVYQETVRASTVRVREVAIEPFIKLHGNHFINKLIAKDIQIYLNDERKRGLSQSFLQNKRTVLSLLFKFAHKHGYVDENIIKLTETPKSHKKALTFESLNKKYLEKEEIQYFLSGLKRGGRLNAYEIAFLLLSTGLRIGEALALTWDDIDFENQLLSVSKTLFFDTTFKFVEPKTPTSYRVVSFNEEMAEIFKLLKLKHDGEVRIGFKNPESEWGNLVFVGRNAQPVQSTTINVVFNDMYRNYGIKGAAGTHILRHTHITMLVEAGVDLPVIMERVGHAHIAITLNIYTHVTEKMKKSSNEKINDYFTKYISKKNPPNDLS